MELSAIVKKYDLPLTRSERDLVDQLPKDTSAISEDRYAQQMKALASVRDVLKQLPDKITSDRQRNMEKTSMLKERLKMLRQIIPFMSPSALKSLNAEMRQIAAQLASLGGASGGGSGGAMVATEATVIDAAKSGGEADTATQPMQANEPARGNGGTVQEQKASSANAVLVAGVTGGDGTFEDRQLKDTVEELKNLYKTVLAAVKRKQQSGRGNGRPSEFTLRLRAYAVIPDRANSVGIKV